MSKVSDTKSLHAWQDFEAVKNQIYILYETKLTLVYNLIRYYKKNNNDNLPALLFYLGPWRARISRRKVSPCRHNEFRINFIMNLYYLLM